MDSGRAEDDAVTVIVTLPLSVTVVRCVPLHFCLVRLPLTRRHLPIVVVVVGVSPQIFFQAFKYTQRRLPSTNGTRTIPSPRTNRVIWLGGGGWRREDMVVTRRQTREHGKCSRVGGQLKRPFDTVTPKTGDGGANLWPCGYDP